MSWRCCICDAAGERKAGRIDICNGEYVPLCALHRAEIRWRLRQPAVTTLALRTPYEQHAMRAALASAGH